MRNKIISGIFCSLLIFLLAAPILPIASQFETMTAMPTNGHSTAMQGPPVEMRVNVFEDESVLSNHNATNYDPNIYNGGLWVGLEETDGWARSWVKYDLSHLQNDIGIVSATLNLYCQAEWNETTGEPIGLYYSANDTWSEETITWLTQPEFDAAPVDVIDAPLGEDLIQVNNWYQFDVTEEVTATYSGDRVLSLVLKQVEETGLEETWKYFVEKDNAQTNSTYLLITYATPEADGLTVEGYSEAPHIDYIQNDTPTLGWEFLGSGAGAAQRDYEVQVWNNEFFNDTLLFEDSRGEVYTVYTSSTGTNIRPWATNGEIRYQIKYEATMFSQGGLIDKLYFRVAGISGTATFENLKINLVNHESSADLNSDFDANYEDERVTSVLDRDVYHAIVRDSWMEFDVENSFVLNGLRSLIIEIRFTNSTGDEFYSPVTSSIADTASVAYTVGAGAYYSQTADWVYNRTQGFRIEFASVPVMEFNDIVSNLYPFATDNGESGRYQQLYNKSLVTQTGIIDTLYFPMSTANDAVFEDFLVRMVETPHEGAMNHTNMDSNFGGMIPTTVIESALYTIRNTGRIAVLKLATPFVYAGEHNLLIDIQWGNMTSGGFTVYRSLGEGGYRAFNLTLSSSNTADNDTRGLDLHLGFVNLQTEVVYDGTALVNATEYFWRVRLCDGTGVWGEWTNQAFKYEALSSIPEWNGLVFDPNPGVATQEVDISLNVTHLLGINQVLLEIDGTNHSMSASGDIYSYTWTPSESGNYTYTIYMESTIGTWTTTSGIFEVGAAPLIPGLPIDNMTLLLILLGVLALIVIVVACRRRKK
ncbi:MAG: DNRLRE domain-containing protein [Candidatus Thorarchaeota archaeon]